MAHELTVTNGTVEFAYRAYRALIVMARAWRESYRQLRACGWDRADACELANLTVTMG
ncbi:MAG: hypothetical protein ACREVG_07700 [Burkholderiales bacterium]